MNMLYDGSLSIRNEQKRSTFWTQRMEQNPGIWRNDWLESYIFDAELLNSGN